MANVLVEETSLSNIANAIRNKNGTAAKYKPNEMANAISQITTSEDLTSELTEQNTLITTQETTIDDIASALQGKSAGGGGSTEIEDSIVTRTITSYTNDRITTLGNHVFRGSGLKSVSLPEVKTIMAYAFDSCASLTDVNLPKVTKLNSYAFQNCTSLARLELLQPIETQVAVWIGCSSLKTLILRGSTVSKLSSTNCFTRTPIADGTGYVYVPDDLLSSYKTATNWSDIANQIKGVSEL